MGLEASECHTSYFNIRLLKTKYVMALHQETPTAPTALI